MVTVLLGMSLVAAIVVAGLRVRRMRVRARNASENSPSPTDTDADAVTARRFGAQGQLHDPVTGLAGHDLVVDRLDGRAARTNGDVAVVLVGFDGLASRVDALGDEAASGIERAIVERLLGGSTDRHSLGRLARDAFTVILDDVRSPADAVTRATALVARFDEPVYAGGQALVVAARAGVSLLSSRGGAHTVRAAITAHDRAATQHTTVEVFGAAMRQRAARRLRLEQDLREAIEGHDLLLRYQPVVDSGTGRILSVEALARWDHPVRGIVSPTEFIPVAEEAGLINTLGSWALHEATAQLQRWYDNGSHVVPAVSVNVSLRQVDDLDALLDDLAHAFSQSPASRGRLIIEITESALARHTHLDEFLDELRTMGVRVHLDDFGTGLSALASLKRLPVDAIKIDRSFIEHIDTDERDVAVVRAITQMAATLGLEAIAEGVDTTTQAATLRGVGCTGLQGFALMRPSAPEVISSALDGVAMPSA